MPPFRFPKSTKIASWRPLGASWSVLEASWGVLGASWSAPVGLLGSFLGASGTFYGAKKLVSSAVLGTFWGVLEASWGRLGRLGASWKYLVRVFHTRRWLHVGLASEMPFFIGFLFNLSSNFNLQNYVNSVSRQGKTYKSNKIIFKDNMPSFRLPKPTKIASWSCHGAVGAVWGNFRRA